MLTFLGLIFDLVVQFGKQLEQLFKDSFSRQQLERNLKFLGVVKTLVRIYFKKTKPFVAIGEKLFLLWSCGQINYWNEKSSADSIDFLYQIK